MPKIGLDKGHGGNDPGAIFASYMEKDITLAIGNRVAYHLRRHNQTVIESRTSDTTVSLSERSNLFNKEKVDLVVSIHVNSFTDKAVQGFEVFTYRDTTRHLQLAKAIHTTIKDNKLYTKDRGIKQANFHMLRETKALACLIETAFLSNEEDRQLLIKNIEGFAVAICKGILKYFEMQYKEEVEENGKIYRVQVGAFSQKANAEKLATELKARGYNTIIV
jgi:N-acetylmuramoyl-L-alanine amidase